MMKNALLEMNMEEEEKLFLKIAEKYVPVASKEDFMADVFKISSDLIDKTIKLLVQSFIKNGILDERTIASIVKVGVKTESPEPKTEKRFYPKDNMGIIRKLNMLKSLTLTSNDRFKMELIPPKEIEEEVAFIDKLILRFSDPKGMTEQETKEVHDMMLKRQEEKLRKDLAKLASPDEIASMLGKTFKHFFGKEDTFGK